jgi:two-component system, NarL family, nitrate/nitrite response regulator NarL
MGSASGKPAIRLGILENRLGLRESLVRAFEQSDIRVVSQTGDPEAFLRAIRRARPTVVIIEIFVRGKETPRLIEEALRIDPGLKVIVVATGSTARLMQQCMQAGAFSCVDRISCPFEMVGIVHAAMSGAGTIPTRPFIYPGPEMMSPSLSGALSRRQLEVLQYIAVGADNLKISAHLAISERTVKAHVHAIYQKLGIENRTQLALFALRQGIPPPSQSV